MPDLSRRSILGSAGAAALASLIPWRPKPQDIVIASEADVPPVVPTKPVVRQVAVPTSAAHDGYEGLIPPGREFEAFGFRWVATSVQVSRPAIDIGEDRYGWRMHTAGQWEAAMSCVALGRVR